MSWFKQRNFKPFLVITAAILLSFAFVVILGRTAFNVGGVGFGLSVKPGYPGVTRVAVPPLGEVSAKTHSTPLELKVSVDRLYPKQFQESATKVIDENGRVDDFKDLAFKALERFVWKLILLAILGGAVGAFVVAGPKIRFLLYGGAAGLVFWSLLLGATYLNFDVSAFRQPSYSGVLAAAPWMTEAVSDRLSNLKAFRKEVKEIAANANGFYRKVEDWQPLRLGNAIKAVHVSDIHNNPAAIDLISQVVSDFKADLVIDTGDITDLGTPMEAAMVSGVEKLGVPYVFVPGNHDSPGVVDSMAELDNVRVLDGKLNLKGIEIAGQPDPVSGSYQIGPADRRTLNLEAKRLERRLDNLDEKPLIYAVHNPQLARVAFRKIPIVLTGHTHKAEVKEDKGYVMINAGTTGAEGLRTLQRQNGSPYTLSVLYISRSQKRLIAIDRLTVYSLEREFRLERMLIDGPSVETDRTAMREKAAG